MKADRTYGSLHTQFVLVGIEGRRTSGLLADRSEGSGAGNEGGGDSDLHGRFLLLRKCAS